MAPIPGLLLSLTKPKDPTLTEEQYNDWYTNKHAVDVVNSGLASVAVRFKNLDPSHPWPYMAAYRLPDLAKLYDMEFMSSLPTDSPTAWGVSSTKADVLFEPRSYQLLKTVQGEHANGGVPKFVLTVETNGDDKDADAFVASFETTQFPVIGAEPGYRRSIIYQGGRSLMPQEGKAGTEFSTVDRQETSYLLLHEFDQLPVTYFEKQKDAGVWKYIADYGTGLYRIEPLATK